jgi:predicted SAM-dependent methyltransferase
MKGICMNDTTIDFTSVPEFEPLKVIIGAGEQQWPGWIATQKEQLDLLSPADWEKSFGRRRADAFLCEHVWEHLTETQGREAARLCFKYLKPGGYLRCAVPDGNYPDPVYQATARVGGPGPYDHPAADHKVVYNCRLLSEVFVTVGFEVDLLEYCDEAGRFHYNQWSTEDGPVYRSLLLDRRNRDGRIQIMSLIVDARKPYRRRIGKLNGRSFSG